ncbi:MAG TPA: TrkA C-terminal domain-containing protein, partial [Thermoanaerobaculia bacterium]|nr:TrkA C-terminal domain-containing protein [Thermoanaerobaculia bacterium]
PQSRGLRIIEIKRGPARDEERVIPGGETVFEAGDRLIVLGPTAAVEALAEGRPVEVTEAEAMARID